MNKNNIYYKVRQGGITKCDSSFYYKVRQGGITRCDSYYITKCDKYYYKVRQVLQSATLLQSVTVQACKVADRPLSCFSRICALRAHHEQQH